MIFKPASQRRSPLIHRWTREQYFQLCDQGYFKGARVELIDGRILDVPAQKNAHVIGVEKTCAALSKAFGREYWVRAQATLNLGPHSAPDPDVAVVPGPRHVEGDYPTTALLVVEVSDSTLWFDRSRKMQMYAQAGIEEYWIVDLVHRQLEVFRQPTSDASRRPRHRYTLLTTLGPKDQVSPLAAPRARIVVAKLLP